MENYKLREDETKLYEGDITLSDKRGITQLILTNLNVVFITKCIDNNFSDVEVDVETFSKEDIKIYQGKPQIKVNGDIVEIYFLSTEKKFKFNSKNELNKFLKCAIDVTTGKTKAERGAEKVKKVINLVDTTLGIDTVKVVGDTLKNGLANTLVGKINKGFNNLSKKIKK